MPALLRFMLLRDRAVVALCLAAVVALAWRWLVPHAGMAMEPDVGFLAAMWWIMMIAMMLPSAAPMILLFGAASGRQSAHRPYVSTLLFAAGYLAVWGVFSLAAAALQWWIETRIEPVMAEGLSSRWASAALLLGAGVYQLTPLKDACLRQCQSPLAFLMSRWRAGWHGGFVMGVQHGAYCVGCCWLLMALLFVGGVMNLWWVVGIAVYVFLEKVVPAGPWLSRALGTALILTAVALAVPLVFSHT
jgi:predicted metal-binding membrane protein